MLPCISAGCQWYSSKSFNNHIRGELAQGILSLILRYNSIFIHRLHGVMILFQGLQFIAETKDSGVIDISTRTAKKIDLDNFPGEKAPTLKNRIHRSYPVGMSLAEILWIHRHGFIVFNISLILWAERFPIGSIDVYGSMGFLNSFPVINVFWVFDLYIPSWEIIEW